MTAYEKKLERAFSVLCGEQLPTEPEIAGTMTTVSCPEMSIGGNLVWPASFDFNPFV